MPNTLHVVKLIFNAGEVKKCEGVQVKPWQPSGRGNRHREPAAEICALFEMPHINAGGDGRTQIGPVAVLGSGEMPPTGVGVPAWSCSSS